MKIRMLFILLLISAIGIFIIAYMFYDHILCLPGYVSGERTSAGPTDGYISQKICYKPYKDRGKICYQKDDCQGECIIPEEKVDELMVCLRQCVLTILFMEVFALMCPVYVMMALLECVNIIFLSRIK
jgi:hypothetical protein